MEMEQQQTNCQKRGKQKCSNLLNFTSPYFFSLIIALLMGKMARVAVNKRRMKKKDKKYVEA
jgi:hypothetical protein